MKEELLIYTSKDAVLLADQRFTLFIQAKKSQHIMIIVHFMQQRQLLFALPKHLHFTQNQRQHHQAAHYHGTKKHQS